MKMFNFDNIGAKIKNTTKWVCWISIILIWIASSIAFIGLAFDFWYICWIPVLAALVLPVILWIFCWFVYAFGELVDKTCAIERNTRGEVIDSPVQPAPDSERLQKLQSLLAQNLITEEEYQRAVSKYQLKVNLYE